MSEEREHIHAAKYADLQQRVQVGHWEWEIALDRFTPSQGAAAILGIDGARDAREGLGLAAFLDRIHPEDRGYVERELRRAVELDQPFDAQHRLLGADGVTRVARSEGILRSNGEGVARVVATTHDLTSAIEGEAELYAAKERFRAFAELTSDFCYILELSPGGEPTRVWDSGDFEAMTGFTPAEFDVIGFPGLIHPEDLPKVAEQNGQLIAKGGALERDYRIITRDGETRWLRDALRVSLYPGGFGRMYGATRDVTEARRSAEDLQRLERVRDERARLAELGALTTRILDAVGNPLAGLSMQAQLLGLRAREGAADPTTLIEIADRIVATVARLDRTIREFTNYTRAPRLEITEVDLAEAMMAAVRVWRWRAAELGVRLWVDVEAGLPPVCADVGELRLTLDELVQNALEAAESGGGRIDLAAERDGDRVRLTISDDGRGIPRGFEPFELFSTTKEGSPGLGLAIVRRVVAAHGGTVTHQERHPKGTTIALELPICGPE